MKIHKPDIVITLIITSLITLLPITPLAYAIIPTNVSICDPSIDCTQNMSFALISQSSINYLTFIKGAQGGFFNQAISTGRTNFAFINFTALTLSANTNPNQNFSISTIGGNIELTQITAQTISLYESNGAKLYYYWDNDPNYAEPTSVTIESGGGETYIPQVDYQPTAGTFNSCISLCVYANTVNRTLVMKSVLGMFPVLICVIGLCPFTVPPSNPILVSGYSPDSDIAIPYIFLFFFIVVLVLILAFSRRES